MSNRTVRKVLDLTLVAAKSAQSFGATAWKYIKVEAVPPFTVGFFAGPGGRQLEKLADKLSGGFINTIAGRIKEMDAEEERTRLEMLAALKAHEMKVKAEAKRKEEERQKEIAKKAAEAVKKAAAAAEQKKAEMAAKEDTKAKAKPKKAEPKKDKRKVKGKKKDSRPKKQPPKKAK